MAELMGDLVKMFSRLNAPETHHHYHHHHHQQPRNRGAHHSSNRDVRVNVEVGHPRNHHIHNNGIFQNPLRIRLGTHFGRGPHGRNICSPHCGSGWRPPAHCVGSYTWFEGRNGSVPHNAVRVGVDKNGGAIYAGRAFHHGDLLPAKVTPSHNCAYVAWGGKEFKKFDYEVMCSSHVGWTTSSRGNVPPEAICVGHTSSGERLYMGRVMHEGTLTPGKIQPSHRVLYISYGGVEISYTEYETMILM